MAFERDKLVIPRIEALRAKLHALPLRRNLLSAGVILSLTAMGAFLPGMLMGPGLKDYVSTAAIGVSASNGGGAEINRTISQVREAVLSPISLGLAVSDLQLQAEDVGGNPQDSRLGFLIGLVFDEQAKAGTPVNPVENALQKAVAITSEPGDRISVSATAASPEHAQRIADYFSTRVIKEVGLRGHEPVLQVLEHARAGLDAADAALTGFQMRHGDEAIAHMKDLQQKAREADATIAALSSHSEELKQAISSVSAMKRDDILTKSLPSLPVFASAEAIRQTYDAARLALAEVNVDHGPKHPRTIAAQSAVDSAKANMLAATRQALEALKRDESTVTTSLDNQSSERAELESQLVAMGDAPTELARLETALDKARRDYLAASDKVGPFARAPYVTATLTEKAGQGLARYDNVGSSLMAVGGAALGLMLSLFVLSFRRAEESEEEHVASSETVLDISTAENAEPEETTAHGPAAVEAIEIEAGIFDDLGEHSSPLEGEVAIPVKSEEYEEAAFEDTREEAANDVPLDERVRQVLMGNLVGSDIGTTTLSTFKLPPLLAAALAGDAEHQQAETEELRMLRQELALLRDRLREQASMEEALRKIA